MEMYRNLVEAIEGLRAQGYTEDFNLLQDCIECSARDFRLFHHEFQIDKFFRFDEQTDPSDESIIYAISSYDGQHKGILINGYGISSESVTDEMLSKLTIKPGD